MITFTVVLIGALYVLWHTVDWYRDLRSWWHRRECAACSRAHRSLTAKGLVTRWP